MTIVLFVKPYGLVKFIILFCFSGPEESDDDASEDVKKKRKKRALSPKRIKGLAKGGYKGKTLTMQMFLSFIKMFSLENAHVICATFSLYAKKFESVYLFSSSESYDDNLSTME